MKKMLLWILIAVMSCGSCTALAESGRIDDRLFNNAKQIMFCLDTGDYQTASALLGCVDMDTLRTLTEQQFSVLGGGAAQTRISVAFFSQQIWYLAVPAAEPASVDVETLLLNCGMGDGFQEVSKVAWGDVQAMLDRAEAVIWNEEYAPDVVVIMD